MFCGFYFAINCNDHICKRFNLLSLLSFNPSDFCYCSKLERTRLPEDNADASKHVAVLTIYKILFIYIYMLCVCWSG